MGSIVKSDKFRWFILIIVPVIYMNFYWYVGFNQSVIKMGIFVLSVLLLTRYFKEIFQKKSNTDDFSGFFKWFIIIILITHLTAYFVWEQSPILTFRATATMFALLYYYVLKEQKVTKEELIKIITSFAVTYVILWLFAVSQAPSVVFGQLDEINDNRGFFRVVGLPGLMLLLLFYFYALYKATSTSIINVKWTTLCVLSLIVVVLSLTRTIIIASLLITAIFLFRKRPLFVIVCSVALYFGGEKLLRSNDVTSSLIELTEEQNEYAGKGELSARNEEYSLCFDFFPLHPITTLFGNGVSHKESEYGQRDEYLKEVYRFHRSDAGYVSLLITYGLLGLILYIWLLYKTYKMKVNKEFFFFKLFIFAFFIVNFTGDYYLKDAIPFILAVYGLELGIKQKKEI